MCINVFVGIDTILIIINVSVSFRLAKQINYIQSFINIM